MKIWQCFEIEPWQLYHAMVISILCDSVVDHIVLIKSQIHSRWLGDNLTCCHAVDKFRSSHWSNVSIWSFTSLQSWFTIELFWPAKNIDKWCLLSKVFLSQLFPDLPHNVCSDERKQMQYLKNLWLLSFGVLDFLRGHSRNQGFTDKILKISDRFVPVVDPC